MPIDEPTIEDAGAEARDEERDPALQRYLDVHRNVTPDVVRGRRSISDGFPRRATALSTRTGHR